jgi:hypothetical protein
MARTDAALWSAVLGAAIGCGGGLPTADLSIADASGEGGDGLGLPRASTVVSLTADEGAHLCDWINQQEGGYGRTMDCALTGGPVTTDMSQSACVMGLADLPSTCPGLTVGDLEDCTLARGTDLCKYFTVAPCAPLRACFCVP